MEKNTIKLDASDWANILDFYDALLKGLGAPLWHGRNINALIDSMIWGGINEIEPPYNIEIKNTGQLPGELLEKVILAKQIIDEGRTDALKTGRKVEVEILIC